MISLVFVVKFVSLKIEKNFYAIFRVFKVSLAILKIWNVSDFSGHKKVNKILNKRSRAGSYFHGIEYEIWADFGLVGNTENKNDVEPFHDRELERP
jgi:hypothetical protein